MRHGLPKIKMLKKKPVWQISSLAILAMIIASSLFFTYHSLFIQEPQNKAYAQSEGHLRENWESGGRFSKYKPEDEVVEMRDIATKQFKNPDGSFTAIITAGPIHYLENGKWKEILIDIEKNVSKLHPDYAFATVQAAGKRFYPSYSNKGLLIDFDNDIYQDWINPNMQWLDKYGKTLASTQGTIVKGTADSNHITYPSVFKNTDVVFRQTTDGRRMDVILKDKSAIDNIPEDATDLAYCEQVIIPEGWTYETQYDQKNKKDITEILFKDKEKQDLVRFTIPVIYEQNNENNRTFGKYKLIQEGSTLTMCKVAPVSWLTSKERQFPVVIDPTANLGARYQTGSTYWSGTVGSTGSKWDADTDVGCWGSACPSPTEMRRGFVYFPTGGIMNGSSISSANLHVINYSNTASQSLTIYPLSANPINSTGSTIYTDAGDGLSLGSTTVGTTYPTDYNISVTTSWVYNSLLTANWVAAGLVHDSATNNVMRFYQYNNATVSYRPYLVVVYTQASHTIDDGLINQSTGGTGYTSPSRTVTLAMTGTDLGSTEGTCYAYWDANTTLGGGTSLGNYAPTCDGNVATPTGQTSGTTYYWCINPVDSFDTSQYDCHAVIYDGDAPTGSISINSGAYYTNSTTLTVTNSISDALSGMTYGEMRFSCDNSTWSTWETYASSKSIPLSTFGAGCTTTAGWKYVYAQFKDQADMATASLYDYIYYDATTPTSLSISAQYDGFTSSTSQSVSWSASDPESGISSYTVYYYTAPLSGGSCGSFSYAGTLYSGGTSTTTTHSPLTTANCYQYLLYAYNGAGSSSGLWSSTITKVDTTAATSLTLTYTNGYNTTGSQTVSWSASDPESGITDYTVSEYRNTLVNGTCTEPQNYYKTLYSGGTSTSATSTMSPGYCYRYLLQVANGVPSYSSYEPTTLTKVDTSGPSAPSNANYSTSAWYNTSSLGLTWTASSDSESGINGYYVYIPYYSTTTTPVSIVASVDGIVAGTCGSSSGSTSFYTATNSFTHNSSTTLPVQDAKCYTYQYIARNNAGLWSSYYSPGATIFIDQTAPSVAPNLTAPTDGYSTDGLIDIAWTTGLDYQSGISYHVPTYQRTTLSNNTCGTWPGSYTSIGGTSALYWNDYSASDGYCYQFNVYDVNRSNMSTPGTPPGYIVKVDTTHPSGGSITYNTQYATSTATRPTLTVSDGSDASTGINTSSRILQRDIGTLSGGSCSGYTGTYSTITASGTYPSVSDGTIDGSIQTGKCYKYQWLVSDLAGNQSTYTSSNEIKYDTSAPTISSFSTNPGWYTSSSNTISWSASDSESGISATYYLYYAQATLSGGTCGTYGSWTSLSIANGGTHNSSNGFTSGNCYKYLIYVYNNAGSYSSSVSGETKVDTSAPTVSATGSSSSWTNVFPNITLSTADSGGSGLNYSKYIWDGSDATCRSSGTSFTDGTIISTPSNGSFTLYLCNADNSGQTGSWSGPYKYDGVAPVVAGGSATCAGCDPVWVNSSYYITMYADDSGYSGLVGAKYIWDPGTVTYAYCWANGTSYTHQQNIYPPTGTHTIYACGLDNAGNTTFWNGALSGGVNYVDVTVPSGTIAINSGATYTNSASVTINNSITDSGGAGMGQMQFSCDNSNWTTAETYSSTKSFNLTSQSGAGCTSTEGNRTVYGKFSDAAGNWTSSTISDSIFLDTTGPVIDYFYTNPGWNTSGSNTISWLAHDSESGMQSTIYLYYAEAPLSAGSCGTYGSWTALSIVNGGQHNSGNGFTSGHCYQYLITFYNNAGGSTQGYSTGDTKVDTVAPTGTISVAGGATYTSSTTPTLNLTASDATSGVSLMHFSCSSSGPWSNYVAFASSYSSFNIAGGTYGCGTSDGTITVYAQYQDTAGNTSTATISDSIILDTSAPTAASVSYTDGYNTTGSQTVSWSATDTGSGIASYTVYAKTAPLSDGTCGSYDASWTTFYGPNTGTSASHTSGSTPVFQSGKCYIYYMTAVNGAGLSASTTTSPTAVTKVDTSAPSAPTNVTYTDGYNTTGSQNVTWTASTDSESGIQAYQPFASSQQLVSGTCTGGWSAWSSLGGTGSTSWTDSTMADAYCYRYYVKASNRAYLSTDSAVPAYITKVDKTAPTGSISINSGAASTNSTTLSITYSLTETTSGLYQMNFSCDNTNWTGWETYATPKSINLGSTTGCSTTSGTKTIYAQFKDNAGNTSSTLNDTITLDTSNPTVTVNQATAQTDPTATSPINFTIVFSEAINPSTFAGTDVNITGTAGGTKAVALSTSDNITWNAEVTGMTTSGTVIASIDASAVQDLAGNGNDASTSTDNTVTWDKTAPTGGSFYIEGAAPNGDTTYTASTTNNTLRVTCPTDSYTPVEMAYGNTASPTNWTSCAANIYNYTLSSGEGTKTVYMRFRDGGGNTTSDVTDTIILDQTAPTGGSFVINNGDLYTTQQSIGNSLNSTCPTDAAGWTPILMAYGNSAAPTNWGQCYTSIGNYNLGSGDGVKTVYVRFADSGTNATSDYTDTITLDTAAPTSNTISINSGDSATKLASTTLTLSSTDTTSGVSKMQFSCNTASWTTETDYSTQQTFNITNQSGAGCNTDEGTKYVYVKYRDTAGNWSTPASDTIIYDVTNPTAAVTITNDFYSTDFNHSSTINGTASDGTSPPDRSGVSQVQITIQESGTNNYWGGAIAGWVTGQTWITATGTTSWTYSIDDTNFTSGHTYTVIAKATDAAGNTGSASASDSFLYDTDVPTVSTITPAWSILNGGATATITGEHFFNVSSVKAGGNTCSSVNVLSSTQLTCTLPAENTVLDGNMEASGTSAWTAGYNATLSKVSGYAGQALRVAYNGSNNPYASQLQNYGAGQKIRVTGYARSDGASNNPRIYDAGGTIIWQCSTYCNSNTWEQINVEYTTTSGTRLDLFGWGSSGYSEFDNIRVEVLSEPWPVDINVTNPNGTGTGTNLLTYYAPPTVTGVSPNWDTANATTGVLVAFSGTNFFCSTVDCSETNFNVQIDGLDCTSPNVFSSTSLECFAPANHAAATGLDVTVQTESGTGTGTGLFSYYGAPTLTSVTPSAGKANYGTNIVIIGTGFRPSPTVTIGGYSATNIQYISSTEIHATTPSSIGDGTYLLEVSNTPDYQPASTNFTFYNAPTVTGVSPTWATGNGGQTLTISGTKFYSQTIDNSDVTVSVGGADCENITILSINSLTCTLTAGASAGLQNISVTTPSGTGTGNNLITIYYAPTITGFSPTWGISAGGTSVTINGTNFRSGAAVYFGTTQVPSGNVTFIGDTALQVITPAHTAGIVAVRVVNPTPDFQEASLSGFEYKDQPTITNVSPSSGPTTGGAHVTITGTYFNTGATVMFGTTSSSSVTVNSSTEIIAVAPAHTAGTVNVTVTNPNTLYATASNAYTYLTSSGSNSTVTAYPESVPADGTTSSEITVTVHDGSNQPVPGATIELSDNGSVGQITYNPTSKRAETNASGIATFLVTSTTRGVITFTATIDPDGTPVQITDTADVRFTCAAGSNQQCAEVAISGSTLPPTFVNIPDSFSFKTLDISLGYDYQYTHDTTGNSTGYVRNTNDVLTIQDSSGLGNWAVQVHSSTFQNASSNYLPLQNFYIVTTEAGLSTQEDLYPTDGVEYQPYNITPQNITASRNASADPSHNALYGDSQTFTLHGATFGTDNTPGSPIEILSAPETTGRIGNFSLNANYMLKVPAIQTPGTYTTTITYDLIYPAT